ncbi:hypothetical protein [Nitrobacter winogradskyi]|uniref:Uncharacterized protein n=2 Tax=Nitrobacter winogradskyi TaxID=913 RepID=A0ACC6ALX0_NITWI|nr:hypothetical protein [Nitrobacter winogradskyi]MCP1999865.1 hypothetical protein [Nitrobacter winogradskyi]GEC17661.1 hypothetical protein NWI01_35530 [Nitrobacter winogradskyi]
MSNEKIGFFDNLVAAAKDNPLAAVLIGAGTFYLFTGNQKVMNAASAKAASPKDLHPLSSHSPLAARERSATAPQGQTGSVVGETLRDVGGAASSAVSGTADMIKDRLREGADYVRENIGGPGEEALRKTQSSLADLFERQPLVLGILGLTAGAAVAGAFRTTDLEKDWMGELSDEVKADLTTRAGAVSQGLHGVVDKIQTELGEAGSEVVDRAKQTAARAANAAGEAAKLL